MEQSQELQMNYLIFYQLPIYANASSIPTTPPDSILYYNVGDDDDGDEYWEDLRGNEDYDIIISNLDRVEVTGITDFTCLPL